MAEARLKLQCKRFIGGEVTDSAKRRTKTNPQTTFQAVSITQREGIGEVLVVFFKEQGVYSRKLRLLFRVCFHSRGVGYQPLALFGRPTSNAFRIGVLD